MEGKMAAAAIRLTRNIMDETINPFNAAWPFDMEYMAALQSLQNMRLSYDKGE